jgi:hypothetical protein
MLMNAAMRTRPNSMGQKVEREGRDGAAKYVPIIALFKIENPLDGAPSVAPDTPA